LHPIFGATDLHAMNMNRIFLILGLLALGSGGTAQLGAPDIGLVVGISNYLGDIGNGTTARRPFIYDLQAQETRFTIGAQALYDFDRIWAIRGGVQYIGIGGDDVHTKYGPRRARNLHFRNNLIEVSARAEGYWRPSQSFGSTGSLPSFYGFAGLGFFYSNPQARELGSSNEVVAVWQDLRPERTEDVTYSPVGLAIPLGIGAKWVVNGGWQVGVEICYRVTTTDYLDDISGFYADRPLTSRATEESVAAAGTNAGTIDQHRFNPSGPTLRGNPNNNDGYGTIQLTLSKANPRSTALGGRRLGTPKHRVHPAFRH